MNAMIMDTANRIPAHHTQHRNRSTTERERKQHVQRLRLVKCGLGLRIRA